MAKEERPVRQIKLELNSDGVLQPAFNSARLASEMVTLTTQSIRAANLKEPPSSGGFFNITFEPRADENILRDQYIAWVLGKGFEELAKGVRGTLEEAYKYTHSLKLANTAKKWGEFEQGMKQISINANRYNFPTLSAAVEKELSSPPDFTREYGSMQQVRNCLEHRNGIVGRIDCDVGTDQLELRLPRLKAFIAGENNEEVEIAAGHYVEKDTEISIKRDIRVRTYGIGERITFVPEEFHEMALACWFFSTDLVAKLPKVPTAPTAA